MRNYSEDIIAFEIYTKQNSLKPVDQCLYYKLLYINYECGWKEWFTVWNDALLNYMSVTDKTLCNARETLVNVKLIEYKQDVSKRKPGIYKTNSALNLINGEIPTTSGEIPLIEPLINGEIPSENIINGNFPTINGKIPSFLVNKVINVNKVSKGDMETVTINDLDNELFDQILNYYKEVACKDMESAKDIELVRQFIGMEGMTFDIAKQGIDQSLKSYKPDYEGKRMPLIYCKTAIYRYWKKATTPKCAIPFVPKKQQHAVPQAENFEQRKYDKEYFENLYEEV